MTHGENGTVTSKLESTPSTRQSAPTQARRCEQLARSCYLVAHSPGVELATSRSRIQRPNRRATNCHERHCQPLRPNSITSICCGFVAQLVVQYVVQAIHNKSKQMEFASLAIPELKHMPAGNLFSVSIRSGVNCDKSSEAVLTPGVFTHTRTLSSNRPSLMALCSR